MQSESSQFNITYINCTLEPYRISLVQRRRLDAGLLPVRNDGFRGGQAFIVLLCIARYTPPPLCTTSTKPTSE